MTVGSLRAPFPKVGLALCLAVFVSACQATDDEPLGTALEPSVCAAGSTVKGVDVSKYQGTIDWPTAKAAGLSFAIARTSDGAYHDPYFATNWKGMKAAGLVRGAYHFFEPDQDAATQAKTMLQIISDAGGLEANDLPCTLDVETDGGQSKAAIQAGIRAFSDAIYSATGKKAMIYTTPGVWASYVNSADDGDLPLWVAHWGVACPTMPNGWSNWKVWQYSNTGSVAGIPATVDLDYFNGSLSELQAFANGNLWKATYVSQSFPLATSALTMTAGSSVAGYIELKNSGTTTWDSKTKLATSNPRDRVSAFAAPDWAAPNRPAAVTATVAPGGTHKFAFTLHAPTKPGTYFEYFGVVEEGLTWFSDPGQGGPPDNQLEVQIQVVAAPVDKDAGAGNTDAGPVGHDAGEAGAGGADGAGGSGGSSSSSFQNSGGNGGGGAGGSGGSSHGNTTSSETDSGTPDEGGGTPDEGGGCHCSLGPSQAAGDLRWIVGLALALGLSRRRRNLSS